MNPATDPATPPPGKTTPYIAAKIAAVEIYENITAILHEDRRTHAESAFATLGSLAGQACLRAALLGNDTLITVSDVAGRHYYYGEAIDRLLLSDRLSVWSLLGTAMQKYRDAALPDIEAIRHHVTQTVGAPQFGIPRLPRGREIRMTPLESLQLWQPLQAGILDRLRVPPPEWHLAYGLAVQKMLAQDALPPTQAALIVMECAVPMSKVLDDTAGAALESGHTAQ